MDSRPLLTRRSVIAGSAGIAALAAAGVETALAPPARASVQWNHPFLTRRSIPIDGEYDNYAAWRQADGLGRHSGVDLDGTRGMNVYNCASGTVTWAGWGNGQGSWGRWIEILHADGTKTGYSHLSASYVTSGQVLSVPTVIGLVGGSGGSGSEYTYSPHLHLTRYTGTIANRSDPTFLVNAALPIPGQQPTSGDDDMPIIYKATTNSSDGLVKAWHHYIQGPDGPLRAFSNLESNAFFAGHPTAIPLPHYGDDIRALIKVVGLREQGPAQGLVYSSGPMANDGRLTGNIVY